MKQYTLGLTKIIEVLLNSLMELFEEDKTLRAMIKLFQEFKHYDKVIFLKTYNIGYLQHREQILKGDIIYALSINYVEKLKNIKSAQVEMYENHLKLLGESLLPNNDDTEDEAKIKKENLKILMKYTTGFVNTCDRFQKDILKGSNRELEPEDIGI